MRSDGSCISMADGWGCGGRRGKNGFKVGENRDLGRGSASPGHRVRIPNWLASCSGTAGHTFPQKASRFHVRFSLTTSGRLTRKTVSNVRPWQGQTLHTLDPPSALVQHYHRLYPPCLRSDVAPIESSTDCSDASIRSSSAAEACWWRYNICIQAN